MSNAEVFKQIFGIYATELWAMSESDFLEWLNAKHIATDSRPKGEWIPISCAVVFGGSEAQWGSQIAGYMCSECEEEVESDTDYQYCPYCGAQMSNYYCEMVDE